VPRADNINLLMTTKFEMSTSYALLSPPFGSSLDLDPLEIWRSLPQFLPF
jgi:hypothetical protein